MTLLAIGASIYDVRTEGWEGGYLREVAWIFGQGEGVKKSENFVDIIYGSPQTRSEFRTQSFKKCVGLAPARLPGRGRHGEGALSAVHVLYSQHAFSNKSSFARRFITATPFSGSCIIIFFLLENFTESRLHFFCPCRMDRSTVALSQVCMYIMHWLFVVCCVQGGPTGFYTENWSILHAVWEISFYF